MFFLLSLNIITYYNAGFTPGGFKEDDFFRNTYYNPLADDAPWV